MTLFAPGIHIKPSIIRSSGLDRTALDDFVSSWPGGALSVFVLISSLRGKILHVLISAIRVTTQQFGLADWIQFPFSPHSLFFVSALSMIAFEPGSNGRLSLVVYLNCSLLSRDRSLATVFHASGGNLATSTIAMPC